MQSTFPRVGPTHVTLSLEGRNKQSTFHWVGPAHVKKLCPEKDQTGHPSFPV